MSELITIKEAAVILGVCYATMYRLVKSGKIKSISYTPKLIRLYRDDIEYFKHNGIQAGNQN